ncbi:hypothetical protein [Flammeovirga sp. OC4]|uniref:hypothetical protein n=1 Tax=Flammeovirga sp. OC4 TaxID=1382345 RepID=UPI0005C4D1B4|nr:hypothetical protein [Flammeovirga sp. OC4]
MSKLKDKIIHEVKKTFLVTSYFAIGFNLLVLLVGLMVKEVELKVGYFGAATFSAALIGKIVVILETVGIDLKLGRTKLLNVVIMKSLLYTVVIFMAIVLEDIIKGMVSDDLTFREALHHLIASFNSNFFLARWIYMFVLFGLYHFIFEVDKFMGTTELFDMVFSRFYKPKQKEYVALYVRWNYGVSEINGQLKALQDYTHQVNQILPKYQGTIASYDLDGMLCLWENTKEYNFYDQGVSFFRQLLQLPHNFKIQNIRGGITKGPLVEAEIGGFLKKEILRTGEIIEEVKRVSMQETGVPLKEV